ncbi:MAG TPA: hypothetical protein PLB91_13390 [Spirochaetales bacterium]|nr:hypothetical protein [Spirochaetales bacterium]HRY53735.1 hypothetical protein [Spirochaetia bacterium]HRZ66009.1 hypothetical protein [Spirochaetia bacterium]
MSRPRSRARPALAAALALAAWALPLAGAPVQASPPAAVPAAGSSLEEARAAAAKAGPGLAALLEASLASLPPRDALSLLEEFRPALASGEERSRLAAASAGLALLLGRFPEAAEAYEEASAQAKGGREPGYLLKAARARLACGEAEEATDLASLVLMSAADPAGSAQARLVGAWALAIQGKASEACAMASVIAAQASSELGAEARREARFLAWACAAPEAKAQAREALEKEFPGSAEALAASGSLPLSPLPHWYLGALSLAGYAGQGSAASPAPARPAAAAPAPQHEAPAAKEQEAPQAAKPVAAASPEPGDDQARRFQVGYYAREENAKVMRDKLAAKGFAAIIEARPARPAAAGDEGRRWAVVVEGGKDPEAVQGRLKDAGFESYPLF